MLYFCLTNRRDFGDVVAGEFTGRNLLKTAPELEEILEHPLRDLALLAVWSQKPQETGQLPNLLVCADGTDQDWAAWLTTFGVKFRPFSAYSRLMTVSELRRFKKASRVPTLNGLTWAVAGLVLGEVLAASGLPDRALDTIPAAAFASTLSFAVFRAAAAYSDFGHWSQLVFSWEEVRKATRQRTRAIGGEVVAEVCAAIIDAGGFGNERSAKVSSDATVRFACSELLRSPDRVPSILAEEPHFASVESRMHGAREDRVVAVNEFARSILMAPATRPEVTSLMLGYLVSRIAPGTIRHLTVLAPVASLYPSAILWYGFCAGLGNAEGGGLARVGVGRAGIDLPAGARRIARDLLRADSLVGAPACDISYLELMALSRTGGRELEGLTTLTAGTVIVELAPGVCSALNVLRPAAGEEPVRAAREKEILATIGESIERLRRAYIELAGNEPPEREQRSLFSAKRKRRA